MLLAIALVIKGNTRKVKVKADAKIDNGRCKNPIKKLNPNKPKIIDGVDAITSNEKFKNFKNLECLLEYSVNKIATNKDNGKAKAIVKIINNIVVKNNPKIFIGVIPTLAPYCDTNPSEIAIKPLIIIVRKIQRVNDITIVVEDIIKANRIPLLILDNR